MPEAGAVFPLALADLGTISGSFGDHMSQLLSRRPGGSLLSLRLFAAAAAVLMTAACAQTRSAGPEVTLDSSAGPPTVLLMPADVQLSLLTTSGLLEPNAEWSQQGRENVIAALKTAMSERRIELVPYGDESDTGYQIAAADEQLVKLHEAVGGAIRVHSYTPGFALPTMKDRFDWTLGDQVQRLRDEHGADYALFVYAQDSFSSAGRVALSVISALLGGGTHGGTQVAFASLVDLDSGKVLWFNLLLSKGGDLRDPKQAAQAIDQLLESSPL